MNYCLDFSIRVEDEMLRLTEATCVERGCTKEDLSIEEEDELYEQARNTIAERDGGKTWADGDVRLGEIILIIDSDTRVVSVSGGRCLLNSVTNHFQSQKTASSSVPWKCTRAQKSPSCNMPPASSKSPITPSKTASPTSLI